MANINPTFYGEGHTPVNHNSVEIILQKILGAIIDNGSGGGGGGGGAAAASQSEVNAGVLSNVYVAPSTLLAATTVLHPANNLTDVASAAISFSNIKQAATTAATGVVQIATQAEVNTGTDAAKEVTPSTLANLALTRGFIKRGNNSNVWTNYEPDQSTNKIYVSASTGSDTRTSISKYNFFMPYLTLTAAVTDSTSGDTIHVLDGTFNEKNTYKNGVNWYLNPKVTISFVGAASGAGGDCLFGDGGNPLVYSVFGKGILSFKNTGAAARTSISEQTHSGSNIYIECFSATQDAATSGTDNSIARCAGGTQVFVCDTAACRVGFAFFTSTIGMGSVNQTVYCRSLDATSQQAFFCDSGNQYVHNDILSGCIVGAIVTASATLQFLDMGNLITNDTGIKCAGIQRGFVKRVISANAGSYGVDVTPGGDQDLYVQSISVLDRAISNRGGLQVLRFDQATSTNALVMQGDAAISHINGMILTGNSATGTVQFTNTANTRQLFLACSRVLNSHASGPVCAMQGTAGTKDTFVIYGGSSLVGQSGSTYCVDTIGAQNVKVYGHIVATKPLNLTNVTLLCGIVEDDADVT